SLESLDRIMLPHPLPSLLHSFQINLPSLLRIASTSQPSSIATGINDPIGSFLAQVNVIREMFVDIIRIRSLQTQSEGNSIFNSLPSPLSLMRQHCMSGISKHNTMSVSPL